MKKLIYWLKALKYTRGGVNPPTNRWVWLGFSSVPLPATTGVLVEMRFLLGFWASCDVRLLLVLGECKFSGFLKDIPTKARKIREVFVFFWGNPKPIIFKKVKAPFFFPGEKKHQHWWDGENSSPEKICLWKVGWVLCIPPNCDDVWVPFCGVWRGEGNMCADVPTLRIRD